MDATMKVTGIIPVSETFGKKTKKEIKEDKKFEAIRDRIIKETLNKSIKEIETLKVEADKIKNGSSSQKVFDLYDNSVAAEKARGKNRRGKFLTALGLALTAAGLVIPATPLAWIGLGVSAVAAINGATSDRGLKSDSALKSSEFKNDFQPYYDNYQKILKSIDKNKEIIMQNKKNMNKKEFNEYMDNFIQDLTKQPEKSEITVVENNKNEANE